LFDSFRATGIDGEGPWKNRERRYGRPDSRLEKPDWPQRQTGLATAANRTGHRGKPDWLQRQTGHPPGKTGLTATIPEVAHGIPARRG
jgi:hypothetical protein